MNNLTSDQKQLFENALKQNQLRDLTNYFVLKKYQHVEIYLLFEMFMLELRKEARESDEDKIADALDFMSGYCSPNLRWFNPQISVEDLQQYKSTR